MTPDSSAPGVMKTSVDEATAAAEPSSARAEYARRLSARRLALGRLDRIDRLIADARLVVFALALVLLWIALQFKMFAWYWSLVPIAVFGGLIVVHERARRSRQRALRAVDFYDRGLGRIVGTWPGTGNPGDRFLDVEHPYAADLDLFGRGSLFERLCTARTRAGEETLAAWLLAPAESAAIRARQVAVAELRPKLDLREDLELLGVEIGEGIDPDSLAQWGKSPRVFTLRRTKPTATLLAILALASFAAWIFLEEGRLLLFLMILIELGFAYSQKGRVRRVLSAIERRTHDLVLIAGLLARLEGESFQAPELLRLQEALRVEGEAASRRIARLARLLHLLDTGYNQFFAPFAALMLWKTHLTIAIDAWRVHSGPQIAGWLAAVGQFEALCALAAFGYENPDDPFPEIDDRETCFHGEGVGHPLILESLRVRNDVSLGGELRVMLISGSNMSGKSTLLRTVGTNTVLALAGASVCAMRLRVSVLAMGATLRIQDSLQAGRSRFYAEITRVRLLVDLSRGPRPLLFLLDEIFHGTNSHDRSVGAGAVVGGLIDRGAIGLVTTHDLALAEFADRLAPRAVNVHFEDQLVDGIMKFDYRMRSGVVRHSNALALMRAVGLDV